MKVETKATRLYCHDYPYIAEWLVVFETCFDNTLFYELQEILSMDLGRLIGPDSYCLRRGEGSQN